MVGRLNDAVEVSAILEIKGVDTAQVPGRGLEILHWYYYLTPFIGNEVSGIYIFFLKDNDLRRLPRPTSSGQMYLGLATERGQSVVVLGLKCQVPLVGPFWIVAIERIA
jgi:hypothetical protein